MRVCDHGGARDVVHGIGVDGDVQVDTLIDSLPHLVDVALLSAFLMVVFGVLGVQLFHGTLRWRCYAAAPGAAEPIDAEGRSLDGVCALPAAAQLSVLMGAGGSGGGAANVGGGTEAAAGATDGHGVTYRGTCAEGNTCQQYGVNPRSGTISFDDIIAAWVTIFQCLTLEGWSEVLYMTSRGAGAVAGVYFVALVWFGSFYVLNLFLAVMWHVYTTQPAEAVSLAAASAAAAGGGSNGRSFSDYHELGGGGGGGGGGSVAAADVTDGQDVALLKRSPLGGDGGGGGGGCCRRWLACVGACACVERSTRRRVRAWVDSTAFSAATVSLILLNIGVMMCERYPLDPQVMCTRWQTHAGKHTQANTRRQTHAGKHTLAVFYPQPRP